MSFKVIFALCFLSLVFCDGLVTTLIVPNDQDQLSLSVKVGEEFSVQLGGNPTTGYSWYLASNENGVLQCTNVQADGRGQYAAKKVPSGFTGAGGNFEFKFTAPNKSDSLIPVTFEYKRPWEGVAVRKVVVLVHIN